MRVLTENKKLQGRAFAHVIDRLDDVIKVVNTQAGDNYHLDQSIQDI